MSGTMVALQAPSGRSATAPATTLQRGQLRVFRSAKKGGGAEPGKPLGEVKFQFNPKEMSIQKTSKWNRDPAQKAWSCAPAQFTGSDPCKLSLELFFDDTEATDTTDAKRHLDSSVADRVEQLFRCLVRDPADPESWPPLVQLEWGPVTSFLGFVSSVQAKYTLFAPSGTPIRATCSVTIEEMPQLLAKQNPTSGTYGVHSEHTLVHGESLPGLAYQEYRDPALWRALAAFNDIDDPMRLRAGSTVVVPELSDLLAFAEHETALAAVPSAPAKP